MSFDSKTLEFIIKGKRFDLKLNLNNLSTKNDFQLRKSCNTPVFFFFFSYYFNEEEEIRKFLKNVFWWFDFEDFEFCNRLWCLINKEVATAEMKKLQDIWKHLSFQNQIIRGCEEQHFFNKNSRKFQVH